MEEKRKNKKESRRFTLKNKSGCARIFAVCLCVLLLASFAAQMISTQGGRIKVEEVTIDSRGAVLSAELYYPAGTSDEDKLPVILVCPHLQFYRSDTNRNHRPLPGFAPCRICHIA